MTKTFLRYGSGDDAEYIESVRAALFGELVKLATPLVEHYHGDVYHDAIWVQANVTGPMEFFFGADDCGTAIGTDLGYVAMSRKQVWHVNLTRDYRFKWEAEVSAVADYDKSCAVAVLRQGLAPAVEALKSARITYEVEQTGGFTMVVTVKAPTGIYAITASDDAPGESEARYLLGFYPGTTWEDGEHEDAFSRDGLPVDQAVAIIREVLNPTQKLNKIVEFDHPFEVLPDGTIAEDAPDGFYAPSILDSELDGDTWEFFSAGYTGQQSYNGPIMHDSEFIGGRLEQDIRETPGIYAVVAAYYTPEDDDEDAETIAEGWAVVRHATYERNA